MHTLAIAKCRNIMFLSVSLLIGSLTPVLSAHAAYCSLRDPVIAIRALYPDATQHKSIVRPVSDATRLKIGELLPFNLHYREVGKHTLYQTMQDKQPLGFVQARSEATSWGLIEIAWAISPAMTIDGLIFQRCRSRECNEQTRLNILGVIEGMNFDQIRGLLDESGQSLSAESEQLFEHSSALYLTILRSALKTLAVTKYTWGDTIRKVNKSVVFPGEQTAGSDP